MLLDCLGVDFFLSLIGGGVGGWGSGRGSVGRIIYRDYMSVCLSVCLSAFGSSVFFINLAFASLV